MVYTDSEGGYHALPLTNEWLIRKSSPRAFIPAQMPAPRATAVSAWEPSLISRPRDLAIYPRTAGIRLDPPTITSSSTAKAGGPLSTSSVDKLCLVFDFGGGTLDVSLVERGAQGHGGIRLGAVADLPAQGFSGGSRSWRA